VNERGEQTVADQVEAEIQESPALDKKYRPKTFDELHGNQELLTSIQSVLSRPTGIPSAFLLSGPSGCGKTTLARIIARKLGGTDSTINEYNISNMTGVDTARKIIDHASFKPFGGKKKIYVLNEAHKASNSFQNCILEILEEPPSYVHFILCTTDPQNLLKTIMTRCTRLQVKALRSSEILTLLDQVCKSEGVEVSKEVLSKVAQSCDGSPRQALVMLDAVIDCAPEEQIGCVSKFSTETTNTLMLCQALMDKRAWSDVVAIILTLENDAEEARIGILSYMEKVLLQSIKGKPGPKHLRAWEIIEAMSGGIFHRRAQLTAKCFELVNS
jgi:replication-associated recombination protein RarA